jgi:Fe-S cluster biogenesis protein NfuA
VHLERTAKAGITPAINMDTGRVNVLSSADRHNVLSPEGASFG